MDETEDERERVRSYVSYISVSRPCHSDKDANETPSGADREYSLPVTSDMCLSSMVPAGLSVVVGDHGVEVPCSHL